MGARGRGRAERGGGACRRFAQLASVVAARGAGWQPDLRGRLRAFANRRCDFPTDRNGKRAGGLRADRHRHLHAGAGDDRHRVAPSAAGHSRSSPGGAMSRPSGMAGALVGFALLGTGTSTPELAPIVTALRLRRPEMAFGQVLGTNFVNLSLLLLGDAFFRGGPIINELGSFEVVSALLGASLIGVFLVGLLEHRDRTIFKMGYDSAVVVVLFAGGLGLLAAL